jgi:lysophospholipase L1-like esterase
MAWNDRFLSELSTASTSPAKFMVVGDSLSEGQGASVKANRWVDLLQSKLRTQFPSTAAGGAGYLPAEYFVYASDSTWGQWRTSTTGTTSSIASQANLGYRTIQMSTSAVRVYTFTGTDLDIWYATNGGSFTWKIDSGTATTVNTAGTYSTANRVQVTGLSAASHTVTITATTGPVYLEGFTVYNGDKAKGVMLFDASHTGAKANQQTVDSALWLATANTVAPGLVIIEYGLNDTGDTNVAGFKARLQTLVTLVKSLTKVPSILIVAAYTPADSGTFAGEPWSAYVTAMSQIATAESTGFLDLSANMPVATTTGTGYYSTDGLHPNNTGHARMADLAYASVIANPYVADKLYYGSAAIDRVYCGSTLVWGLAPVTSTVGTLYDFTGTNGAIPTGWAALGTANIQNNMARFPAGTTAWAYVGQLYNTAGTARADYDVTFALQFDTIVEQYFAVMPNAPSAPALGALPAAGTVTLTIYPQSANTGATITQVVGTTDTNIIDGVTIGPWTANTPRNIRMKSVGSTLYFKIWTGATEPAAWTWTGSALTTMASGKTAFKMANGPGTTAKYAYVDNAVIG